MPEQNAGRIVVSYGNESVVEAADGALRRVTSRRSAGRPVCGDFVHWSDSGDGGVIEALVPRRNEIARPNYRGEMRPIAANVDLLIITVAVLPPLERGLVDRYLVLAAALEVEALVFLNKIDLADEAERAELEQDLSIYAQLGYPLIFGSTRSGEGVAELAAALRERTGILVGPSGVGKSSLVQRLLPDQSLRIGALSEASGLGRHTTTETTLYRLPNGGELIDSPGIRMLRLGHLSEKQIARGFIELRPYLNRCRFRDCGHRAEPGCAVQEAAAQGKLSRERLASYHEILESAL